MSTYILIHGSWQGKWCWDKVVPLLQPEPIMLGTAPVHITPERFGQIPLQDRVVLPRLQKQMYTVLPCQAVLSLDPSHSPFFSAPEELVKLFLSA
jgi:hypothetical protein